MPVRTLSPSSLLRNWRDAPKELPTTRRFPVNDLRILATGSFPRNLLIDPIHISDKCREGMVSAEFARASREVAAYQKADTTANVRFDAIRFVVKA